MTQTGRRARVVHAIPGRLRIRFEGAGPAPSIDGLAAVRVVPGVLAVETRPAARSAVVQYDPAATTEALVLAELERVGVVLARADAPHPPTPSPASGRGGVRGTRGGQGRAQRPAEDTRPTSGPTEKKAGERGALMEMLIGPPPKLDRRFAESLALSLVSLLAARRVGLALGGGTTLPAYFAIWFALRRLTGAGRRRA
jgi:hypothetical protein